MTDRCPTWLSDFLVVSYLRGIGVRFAGGSGRALDGEDVALLIGPEIARRVTRMEAALGVSLQEDTVLRALAGIEAWTTWVQERTGVSLDARVRAAVAGGSPSTIVPFLRTQPPVVVPVAPSEWADGGFETGPAPLRELTEIWGAQDINAPDRPLVMFQDGQIVPAAPALREL